MKPVIFYVDDQAQNLTVFEASLPEDWDIHLFTNPMEALEALEKIAPAVIVSDQRMPGITGVRYLELAKKIHPNAVRIIVTGYSEEDLVIESVRKAQIFDYIKKPWEPDDLEASIHRAVEFHRINEEVRTLHEELVQKEAHLKKQNEELVRTTEKLKKKHQIETDLRKELECWAPHSIIRDIRDHQITFPFKRDMVGLTFDIIESNKIHKKIVNGKSIRALVIQRFSEAVLRNGGWRESHSGDSAYAHFGLLDTGMNPFASALSAAREFRVLLRGISENYRVSVECGIAIHVARECLVDVHVVQLQSQGREITQKSFDTTSVDIDILHRMEKLVHCLEGSNIIMSGDFLTCLGDTPPKNLHHLTCHQFKGHDTPLSTLR